MALYDTDDCVQRCRDQAQLPDDDERMDATAWHRLLTQAQSRWVPILATAVPQALFSDPQVLAPDATDSAEGLALFHFGTDEDGEPIVPLQVEVYRTQEDAWRPEGAGAWGLRPGVHFTAEGDRLRFPLSGALSFADGGPWVRMIEPPGVIDSTHNPTMMPIHARELLVLGAVETWATQGGLRDPSPWIGQAQALWNGSLRAALRRQYVQPAPIARRGGSLMTRVSPWGLR